MSLCFYILIITKQLLKPLINPDFSYSFTLYNQNYHFVYYKYHYFILCYKNQHFVYYKCHYFILCYPNDKLMLYYK